MQAIHTAETWDGRDKSTLVPFLDAEIDRALALKRGAKPRPTLAIVAGTDMEGANGNAA